jgi:hypothetical protein
MKYFLHIIGTYMGGMNIVICGKMLSSSPLALGMDQVFLVFAREEYVGFGCIQRLAMRLPCETEHNHVSVVHILLRRGLFWVDPDQYYPDRDGFRVSFD